MILNAYAVLDLFASGLRLALAVLVLGLGVSAWRSWRHAAEDPERRRALEDRSYLLFLLGGTLLALNVLSWPLLYLLLQSYVPEWPGVMCVYGVTRIGAGSIGPARFLPPLLTALQVAKPALVFLSGAWFVLYLINRRTETAPLTGRVIGVLLAAGLLAAADAAAETGYLLIPKKEEFVSGGCCTVAFDGRPAGGGLFLGPDAAPRLTVVYYAVNVGTLMALAGSSFLCRTRSSPRWVAPLPALALLGLAVGGVFLVEVAAPRLDRLPYHHCPYDLVTRAPESLVAVALFFGGVFLVGWACVAAWLGGRGEAAQSLPEFVSRLLGLAFLCYLGSLIMTSVELALA